MNVKQYLIVFLFIFFSQYIRDIHSRTISATIVNKDKILSENIAKEYFRKELLKELNNSYRLFLSNNYSLWIDSKQNINNDLLNYLISNSEKEQHYDSVKRNYSTSFHLYSKEIISILESLLMSKENEINLLYNKYEDTGNSLFLLKLIDILITYPIVRNNIKRETKTDITRLLSELKNNNSIELEFPDNIILFKNHHNDLPVLDFEIIFAKKNNSLNNIPFNFYIDDKLVKTLYSSYHDKVHFNHYLSEIKDKKLLFKIDYNSYYSAFSFSNQQFIKHLIDKYHPDNTYKINLKIIENTRFEVSSTNFPEAIVTLKNHLISLGWANDNKNPTLKIVIEKVIIDQRVLNIGVYYIKAYLSIIFQDQNANTLLNLNLPQYEVFDTDRKNAERKIILNLINSIKNDFKIPQN